MAQDRPSPLLLPLRLVLAVTALATLVVLFLVALSSCHHAGQV